jgi:hypothetical protein
VLRSLTALHLFCLSWRSGSLRLFLLAQQQPHGVVVSVLVCAAACLPASRHFSLLSVIAAARVQLYIMAIYRRMEDKIWLLFTFFKFLEFKPSQNG